MQQHDEQVEGSIELAENYIENKKNVSSRYKTLFHKNSNVLTPVTTASCGILLLIAKKRKKNLSGRV
jgi:hypothetical protein